MSYFTAPSSNGQSWGHPGHTPQHPGHQHIAGPSHPNAHQPNVNPMYAMMAMMQQMQGVPSQNYPQQYAQPQMTAPAVEPQRLPIPHVADNSLIAQILFEQTKRGLTYKAALESLHGHNGIAAYAWKDHFLEHKPAIDELVNKLKEQASASSWIKLEPHRSANIPVDGQGISSHMIPRKQSSSLPPQAKKDRAHSRGKEEPGLKRERPHLREENELRRPKPTKALTPSHSDMNVKNDVAKDSKEEKESNGTQAKAKAKVVAAEGSSSSRRTLNSLSSTPAQTLLALIPAGVPIDTYTGLPAAPSRSPSPPTTNTSNKYTDQDAIFFFKRIAYDLQRDSDLTKANLCDILGEKAPHHSAMSWRTYWTKKEDVADKMLLLTRLDDEDREEVIRSWKTGRSIARSGAAGGSSRSRSRNVSYKESSASELSEEEAASSFSGDEGNESDAGEEDFDFPSTEEDEEIGEAGTQFTIAEMRALAKHIASTPEWVKGRREWDSFTSAHKQRTAASWKEFYRRKANEIDAFAKKYIDRAKEEQEISAQRGKPSWARTGPHKVVTADSVSAKRLHVRSDSREKSEEKRARIYVDSD